MRCICERKCQVRTNGKARLYKEGEIAEFDECPDNFRELGKRAQAANGGAGPMDYDGIGVTELAELEGDVEDLKAHVSKHYPEVSYARNIGWDTLLTRYLQAREEATTIIDNTGKRKNIIVNIASDIAQGNAEDEMVKLGLEDLESEGEAKPEEDDLDKILGE